MKPKYRWYVEVQGHRMLVDAPTKNNAAYLAFRTLISMGKIKNRPRTSLEGGWENTFVICKGLVGASQPLKVEPGIDKISDLVEGA